MKKLIALTIVLFTCLTNSFGQEDTIQVENFVDFNKELLGDLSPSLYGGRLINRASIEDITLKQLLGEDNKPHNFVNWMYLYADIYNAYVDNSNFLSVEELYSELEKKSFDYRYPDTSENIRPMPDDIVHESFGLILEEVYKLKDSAELVNFAEVQNNKLVPTGNENDMYEKFTLKSTAVMNFYNAEGFNSGVLHYEEDFIVTSPNISISSIEIDVGNGFTLFGNRNNELEFSFSNDTTLAKVAVSYYKNEELYSDTLSFILATQPSAPFAKNNPLCVSSAIYDNTDFYDFHFSYSQPFTSLQFDVGVIIGCGNESQVETLPPPFDNFPFLPDNHPIKNVKRPIIMLPPYRPNKPTEQKFSMGFYYCKYNIDGFIDEMVSKGYDIIIIKESPGDQRIATGGRLLADFITEINRI